MRPAKVKEVKAVIDTLHHVKVYQCNAKDENNLSNQSNQLLVLSGPAGSGKSTLIRLLAEEDNIPIVEWETILDRYNEPGMYIILFFI